ncbi:hypothetical protein M409DRAFT_21342 [Zasmidium cellare ATCC 36951]|uniref:Non-homologous end-joining factor 1 n=1 Tax=Zasmidium cellare ATCC 36951 TaxID=1080233 RepID=A0A6A6CPJ6_ZASCE|nr:uncharacterized protein M409DRAFT_21342 [Zasmidium cellare ATCC 36951]KAF2168593.1 hypothetical protein M409DRAFT_21342 [Zasmidium cellare ATCC 36951]
MVETISWRALELGEEGLPQLLAKTRLNKSGYEIQLTDLSRIWGEELGKEDIVKRAGDEGCSIDPSEDDQYDILLEKIEGALRGDKGTTLSLSSQQRGDVLQLDLSAPLPGSLPTFVWSIRLARLPDSAVGLELVTPLVAQAARLRDQMQLLIGELSSKDHVIGKITDRLEASGNDLTAVFPGASGIKLSRKKSQRGQLAGHVKGLADFDEHTWRASLKQNDGTIDLSSEVLNSVLDHLPVAKSPIPVAEWWRDLANSGARAQQLQSKSDSLYPSQNSVRQTRQQQVENTNGQPLISTEQSLGEDEFRRQVTPPKLKKAHPQPDDGDAETDTTADEAPKSQQPDEVDDEETDDDDLDAVPSKASSSQTKGRSQQQDEKPHSNDTSYAAPRKLGVLGGKKSKSPQPQPQPEPEADTEDEEEVSAPAPTPKTKGKLGAFGVKKAASPQTTPEQEPEPVQDSPPKKRARLGAFGGSSKKAATSEEATDVEKHDTKPKSKLGTLGGRGKNSTDTAPTVSHDHEAEPPPSPAKRKLGTLGGKGGSKSEESGQVKTELETARQSRAPERKEEQEEHVREDSQERADKKRERLKRELEEKAKAPVKKKRKF